MVVTDKPPVQQRSDVFFAQVVPATWHHGDRNTRQAAEGLHIGRDALPVILPNVNLAACWSIELVRLG